MISVFDACDFFIQLANACEGDCISNLKLNKLLYYAQGVHLARTGGRLFDNAIEAWKLGPVVPEAYRRYRVCGSGPIQSPEQPCEADRFSAEELETLMDVQRELGQYTASKLVSLTHRQGTPWSEAYHAEQVVITDDAIREYFRQHPVPYLSERLPKTPAPNGKNLPKDWYDEAEDAAWEGYPT